MNGAEDRTPPLPPRAKVLRIPLAVSRYEEVLDWMEQTVAAGSRASLTAAAVNLVMSAADDEQVRDAVLRITLAVPDGQPLVWALRSLGHAEATRVYGPDLMAKHCERAAASHTPIYLYGGRDEERLALLCKRLEQRFPGLRIAGSFAPPFRPLTATERDQVIEDIDGSGAAVVWVGTGQPKQELWIAEMRPLLDAPLLVGVGAAFDFHAGLLAQAPSWMQHAGLEWLFRLSREPKRLWRRYASQNPRFIAAFARQWLHHRNGVSGEPT